MTGKVWLLAITGLILCLASLSVFGTVGVFSDGLFSMTADPERPFIYVSDVQNGSILVLDTTSETLIDNIAVGNGPTFMDINPDGGFLAVSLNGGRSVTWIPRQ